jgi:hypothetical protein
MNDGKLYLSNSMVMDSLYKNTDKISQQPENCENRNDPDLVQAFLKKLWFESDFKAPNLPLSLWLKVSGALEFNPWFLVGLVLLDLYLLH